MGSRSSRLFQIRKQTPMQGMRATLVKNESEKTLRTLEENGVIRPRVELQKTTNHLLSTLQKQIAWEQAQGQELNKKLETMSTYKNAKIVSDAMKYQVKTDH